MYEVKESFNKNIIKDLLRDSKKFLIPFCITFIVLAIIYFIVSLGVGSFIVLLILGTICVNKILEDLNPREKNVQ